MRTTLSLLVGVTLSFSVLRGQTPAPVVMQPAGPVTAQPGQPAQVAAADAASGAATLKLLQDMKAANEETLKKQQAVLLQLDEIQKAADQVRIYTKRS